MRVRLDPGLIPAQRRRRELAADGRAGAFARGRARAAQREFIQRRWRWAAGWLTIGALAQVPLLVMPGPLAVRCYLAGVIASIAVGSLWFWVVQETGTAPVMRGDSAERQTAGELRRMRRRGWRLINHFMREHRDIDHVLVGPGVVLVVSTKWSASPWILDSPGNRLIEAADQVAGDARVIRSMLKRHDVKVTPVLMLWGRASEVRPARVHEPTGTVVICGAKALRSWLAQLPRPAGKGDVESAWTELSEQVRRRDAREQPTARTGESMAGRALVGTGVAVAVFLGLAAVITATRSLAVALDGPALAMAVGILGSHRPATRLVAIGWLAGAVAAVLVVFGSIIAVALT